ncbi:MAG: dihydroorotate dehydrogenase electron transfer subunit [Melioribacteraceae bacterium]|nr:dihydroorotate dehydrogenase electron transfer subunit [Melioribacteraceae bacterium]
MIKEIAKLEEKIRLNENTYLIKVLSSKIAEEGVPGQFCNIKVSESNFPLLRRPFSISNIEDEFVFFMFDVQGEGTKILSQKESGDELDILGPLGNGFGFDDDFDTAVIVAGGIGVAAFPFLIDNIPDEKEVYSFIGGRTDKHVITNGMENILISTDDGSLGIKGNVIDLLKRNENLFEGKKIKMFACGPNPMLKALQSYAIEKKYNCELSIECAMACGFGICQGCVVEDKENEDKFKLVCVDGPVFDVEEIEL